ncbi:hypothetical protein QWY29_14105 [Nocardioides sp. SOB72]|uniref:WXG100 family type VII secretion target n=1 Tax=Nocardioides abyssi TaxID=3058370 RepID=A0ABT8EWD2_9ACTN|nr:hypothetical protein [Nocardioides abyssi]
MDERVEEVAVAAMDSAMYWHMRDKALSAVPGFVDDGAVIMDGSPETGWIAAAGSFPFYVVRRYPSPLNGATPPFDLAAFGIDVPEVSVDDKVEPDVPAGYLEDYRSTLAEVSRRWRSLPPPEGIVNAVVTPILEGMHQIASTPSQLASADDRPVFANPAYVILTEQLDDATPHLDGVAMDYFKEKYVAQLGTVVPNLQLLMGKIAEAALGNALAIQRSRLAVLTILDAALDAMQKAKPGSDYGGVAVALAILGAVAAAAATLFSAGTAVPFLLAAGGGALGVLSGQVADAGSQPPQVELGAAKPDGVVTNISSALDTANAELLAEEQAAAYLCFDQLDLLAAAHPAGSDPFAFNEPPASTGRLVVNIERFQMAKLWNNLPQVASRVRDAAAHLARAVDNPGVFQHGSVGRSTLGAQPDIASAGNAVWTAMRAVADDLDEAAQGLKDVWRDFSDTDGLTRREFKAIQGELSSPLNLLP